MLTRTRHKQTTPSAEDALKATGFSPKQWRTAKREIRDILVWRAKERRVIPYSELVSLITAISIEPHDPKLFRLLGELSTEEDAAGRCMLSAIVVHKSGGMEPGDGFFDLARKLGRNTSDRTKCWVEEVTAVYTCYASS